jgi:hypothetical protein
MTTDFIVKPKTTKRPKVHYVDNKAFQAALLAYKRKRELAAAEGRPEPRIPDYIGICIMDIAKNLATKGNFVNYTYKEEMIGDGIENCIKYMNNYDPDNYKNPLAYFTRIVWNQFILRIDSEKKETYVKYKSLEAAALSGELNDYMDGEGSTDSSVNINDNMKAFVETYEKKLADKKKSAKEKKEKKTALDLIIGEEENV